MNKIPNKGITTKQSRNPPRSEPAFDPTELERLAAEADGVSEGIGYNPEDIAGLVESLDSGLYLIEPAAPSELFDQREVPPENVDEVIKQTVAALTGTRKVVEEKPPADEPIDILRQEIDKQIIDQLLDRMTPSQKDRRDAFIASLPSEARRALHNLARLYGVTSLDEMFYSGTPDRLRQLVESLLKLDLTRIWKAYHEA